MMLLVDLVFLSISVSVLTILHLFCCITVMEYRNQLLLQVSTTIEKESVDTEGAIEEQFISDSDSISMSSSEISETMAIESGEKSETSLISDTVIEKISLLQESNFNISSISSSDTESREMVVTSVFKSESIPLDDKLESMEMQILRDIILRLLVSKSTKGKKNQYNIAKHISLLQKKSNKEESKFDYALFQRYLKYLHESGLIVFKNSEKIKTKDHFLFLLPLTNNLNESKRLLLGERLKMSEKKLDQMKRTPYIKRLYRPGLLKHKKLYNNPNTIKKILHSRSSTNNHSMFKKSSKKSFKHCKKNIHSFNHSRIKRNNKLLISNIRKKENFKIQKIDPQNTLSKNSEIKSFEMHNNNESYVNVSKNIENDKYDDLKESCVDTFLSCSEQYKSDFLPSKNDSIENYENEEKINDQSSMFESDEVDDNVFDDDFSEIDLYENNVNSIDIKKSSSILKDSDRDKFLLHISEYIDDFLNAVKYESKLARKILENEKILLECNTSLNNSYDQAIFSSYHSFNKYLEDLKLEFMNSIEESINENFIKLNNFITSKKIMVSKEDIISKKNQIGSINAKEALVINMQETYYLHINITSKLQIENVSLAKERSYFYYEIYQRVKEAINLLIAELEMHKSIDLETSQKIKDISISLFKVSDKINQTVFMQILDFYKIPIQRYLPFIKSESESIFDNCIELAFFIIDLLRIEPSNEAIINPYLENSKNKHPTLIEFLEEKIEIFPKLVQKTEFISFSQMKMMSVEKTQEENFIETEKKDFMGILGRLNYAIDLENRNLNALIEFIDLLHNLKKWDVSDKINKDSTVLTDEECSDDSFILTWHNLDSLKKKAKTVLIQYSLSSNNNTKIKQNIIPNYTKNEMIQRKEKTKSTTEKSRKSPIRKKIRNSCRTSLKLLQIQPKVYKKDEFDEDRVFGTFLGLLQDFELLLEHFIEIYRKYKEIVLQEHEDLKLKINEYLYVFKAYKIMIKELTGNTKTNEIQRPLESSEEFKLLFKRLRHDLENAKVTTEELCSDLIKKLSSKIPCLYDKSWSVNDQYSSNYLIKTPNISLRKRLLKDKKRQFQPFIESKYFSKNSNIIHDPVLLYAAINDVLELLRCYLEFYKLIDRSWDEIKETKFLVIMKSVIDISIEIYNEIPTILNLHAKISKKMKFNLRVAQEEERKSMENKHKSVDTLRDNLSISGKKIRKTIEDQQNPIKDVKTSLKGIKMTNTKLTTVQQQKPIEKMKIKAHKTGFDDREKMLEQKKSPKYPDIKIISAIRNNRNNIEKLNKPLQKVQLVDITNFSRKDSRLSSGIQKKECENQSKESIQHKKPLNNNLVYGNELENKKNHRFNNIYKQRKSRLVRL